jgi:hypothetical protein
MTEQTLAAHDAALADSERERLGRLDREFRALVVALRCAGMSLGSWPFSRVRNAAADDAEDALLAFWRAHRG